MTEAIVRIVVDGRVVVARIEQRAERVSPQHCFASADENRNQDKPIRIKGRKDSKRSSLVKTLQRHCSIAFAFVEQKPRDQEAAQHKEDHHAVSSRHEFETKM